MDPVPLPSDPVVTPADIDGDHAPDDQKIAGLIASASEWVWSLGLRYDPARGVPSPIKEAIVLKVRHSRLLTSENLFLRSESVEGVGSQQFVASDAAGAAVEKEVARLLSPYRIWPL